MVVEKHKHVLLTPHAAVSLHDIVQVYTRVIRKDLIQEAFQQIKFAEISSEILTEATFFSTKSITYYLKNQ